VVRAVAPTAGTGHVVTTGQPDFICDRTAPDLRKASRIRGAGDAGALATLPRTLSIRANAHPVRERAGAGLAASLLERVQSVADAIDRETPALLLSAYRDPEAESGPGAPPPSSSSRLWVS